MYICVCVCVCACACVCARVCVYVCIAKYPKPRTPSTLNPGSWVGGCELEVEGWGWGVGGGGWGVGGSPMVPTTLHVQRV